MNVIVRLDLENNLLITPGPPPKKEKKRKTKVGRESKSLKKND